MKYCYARSPAYPPPYVHLLHLMTYKPDTYEMGSKVIMRSNYRPVDGAIHAYNITCIVESMTPFIIHEVVNKTLANFNVE